MHNFFKKLKGNKELIFLMLVSVGLIYQSRLGNGQWLSGWDNLHPEFNLGLNIFRSIGGVWQEYQGLGLPGGMAHLADLPRQILLLLLSVFFKVNSIRWVVVNLMLLVGPMGVYFLMKQISGSGRQRGKVAAMIAGLAYLMNLATVQYFYVPYESFVGFYGMLPWLIWANLVYIQKGGRKSFAKLVLITLLSTWAFYVHTLFVVYVILLIPLFIAYFIKDRKGRVIKAGLVLFIVNSFWLLPAIYGSVSSSSYVINSKINSVATPETYYMNMGSGNLLDVLTLRGYWLEYVDWVSGSQYDRLMGEWYEWSSGAGYIISALIITILSLWGYVRGRAKKKDKLWTVVGLIVSYAMLSGLVYSYVGGVFPVFSEIFRSSFTKWSIPMAMFISLGLGLFSFSLIGSKKKLLFFAIFPIFAMVMVIYPAVRVGMISEKMKSDIPREYFELFKYMEDEPSDIRLAVFPMESYWGWDIHEWGYSGSGFLWYGIKQPILDRAFDVWSGYNEGFYQEFSRAIYTSDRSLMDDVLDKYDVGYVLIDESIIEPGKNKELLRSKESREMLSSLGSEKVWSEGYLSLWKTSDSYTGDSYIQGIGGYRYIKADTYKVREDELFNRSVSYVEGGGDYYPLTSLMREDVTESVSYRSDLLGRERVDFSIGEVSGEMVLPAFDVGASVSLPVVTTYRDNKISIDFQPFLISEEFSYPELNDVVIDDIDEEKIILSIGGNRIPIELGSEVRQVITLVVGENIRVGVYSGKSENIDVESDFESGSVNECWVREEGQPSVSSSIENGVYTIDTRDAAGCLSIRVGELESGVVKVHLPYRSDVGARPNFCFVKEGDLYKCLHDDVFYTTKPSEEWVGVERDVEVDEGVYWLDVTARPPDTKGEAWSIVYESPRLEYYPLIKDQYVTSEFWSGMGSEIRHFINSEDFVLSLLVSDVNIDFVANGKTVPENCDVLKRGEIEKMVNGKSVQYNSYGRASLCDVTILKGVSQSGEYLMRFRGENMSGRSLKFYLYSPLSGRSEMENLLPEGEFDESYSILPVGESDDLYTLTVETRSFGERSENRLDLVDIYSLPLEWLGKVRVTDNSSILNSDFRVDGVEKVGTWFYQIKGSGEGILSLSQGYDEGWIAWDKGGKHELLKHVKVDGWKNGWVYGEGDGEVVIRIMYWPQLLEYAGFLLLIGGFFWVLRANEVK